MVIHINGIKINLIIIYQVGINNHIIHLDLKHIEKKVYHIGTI